MGGSLMDGGSNVETRMFLTFGVGILLISSSVGGAGALLSLDARSMEGGTSETTSLFIDRGHLQDNQLSTAQQGQGPPDPLVEEDSDLPAPRWGASTVWTGTEALLFGGMSKVGGMTASNTFDLILQYDADKDEFSEAAARLPTDRRSTSAAWTGDAAFVFGGREPGNNLDEILRYDPDTSSVEQMTAQLPTPRERTSAVWTGDFIYVFGGLNRGTALREIVRYNPRTDQTQVMDERLPTGLLETSTVWTGEYVFLFGGSNTQDRALDLIVRYDPDADSIQVLNATLPSGRSGATAVWANNRAYVFGGFLGGETTPEFANKTDDIVMVNPRAEKVFVMNAELPTDRHLMESVWTGENVFLFGGTDVQRSVLDDLLRYQPLRDHPRPPGRSD